MVVIDSHAHASPPAGVGFIDIAVYLGVLGISAALLPYGGAVAIAAAAIGAGFGYSRKDCRTRRERLRSAWDSSFAALWAGAMIGGMIAA